MQQETYNNQNAKGDQELAEDKRLKQSWPVRVTHFLVNFVGIGWVLNAYVSVEIYKAVKRYKPHFLVKPTEKTEKMVANVVKAVGGSAGRPTIANISKDLVEIVALGTGGFLVLPLQKIYAAHRVHITRWVENISRHVKGQPSLEPDEKIVNKEESVESMGHWAAGRAVAFVVSISLYMTLKYKAGNAYTKMNEAVVKFANNYFPKKFIPNQETAHYYLAEQVTSAASVATLAATKTSIDKMFPAKPKRFAKTLASGHKAIMANDAPKSFRERAEMKSAEPNITPI